MNPPLTDINLNKTVDLISNQLKESNKFRGVSSICLHGVHEFNHQKKFETDRNNIEN